jgi:hypothetical protein
MPFTERLAVTKTRISSTDLVWICRERLSSFDDRFKTVPLAIVPAKGGWEVVTTSRYRTTEPEVAKRINQIQIELLAVYSLERD